MFYVACGRSMLCGMLTVVMHVHSLSGVDQEEVARRCEAEESRVTVDPDVGAARIQQLVRQVSTLTCGTAAALWATVRSGRSSTYCGTFECHAR